MKSGFDKEVEPRGLKEFVRKFLVRSGNIYFSLKREPRIGIRRILVIVPLGIGDVLMATPAIRALRKKFPDVVIDCICHSWGRIMLEGNPNIDSVIVEDGIYNNDNLLELRRIAKNYKGYDVAVVFSSFLVPLFAYFAGIPIRTGYERHNEGFALTRKTRYALNRHVVQTNLAAVNLLPGKSASVDEGMELFLSKDDKKFSKEFLEKNKLRGKIVGIGAGGGENPGGKAAARDSRRWPQEKYAELVKRLSGEGIKVILFGSKAEKNISQYIAKKVGGNVLDITGKTSIKQAAALMKACGAFVTNDCGLMHMAAAVGTPVISIFGPTLPVMKAPLGRKHGYIWKKIACSPCYESRRVYECKSYECMNLIRVEEVFEMVKSKLK